MESSGRTLVCSVLFLDIAEYSKKPVSDQLQLKQEFNRLLTKSLEQVPARDRIILDTGDGAAVTFMGDPEDALFAAMAVRDSAGAVAVGPACGRRGAARDRCRRGRRARPAGTAGAEAGGASARAGDAASRSACDTQEGKARGAARGRRAPRARRRTLGRSAGRRQ